MRRTTLAVLLFAAVTSAVAACKSSSSSSSNQQFAKCSDANLVCAQGGTCPSGTAFVAGGDVIHTCDGTSDGEDCCGPCAAPNVIQEGLCLSPGEAQCRNLGGFCADPLEDGGGSCDIGSTPTGDPKMCSGLPCCLTPSDEDGGVDSGGIVPPLEAGADAHPG